MPEKCGPSSFAYGASRPTEDEKTDTNSERLSELEIALSVDDKHLVTYSLVKLVPLGIANGKRFGKEVFHIAAKGEPDQDRSGSNRVGGQAASTAFPNIAAMRVLAISSASDMIRSINSRQVGTSLIRPATMPQLHAPISVSPSFMIRR